MHKSIPRPISSSLIIYPCTYIYAHARPQQVRASLAPLLKDDPLATAYLLRETEAI